MTSTAFQAGVNLAKISVGTGILALPFSTINSGGLIISPILNAGIAVLNGISSMMMIRCKKCINTADIPDTISSTYSQIAYAAFGINGSRVVDTCIAITLLGVCTTYLIAASQMIYALPYMSHVASMNLWIVLIALVVFPMSSLKTVDSLAPVSFWGIFFLLLSILVVVMFGMTNYYSQQYEGEEGDVLDERKYPLLPPSGFVGILNYIGTATFCYGQCSIIFPVEESMQDRSQIVNALIYCLLFVWAIYAFVGDFVAILYIHATGGLQSNILLNLPADSVVSLVVSLLMVGVCILSYPLTILPAATMIERWLVSMFPSLSSLPENREYLPLSFQLNETSLITNSTSYNDGNEDSKSYPVSPLSTSVIESKHESGTNRGKELYEPHTLARYICRLVLVMITALLAISIPCFALLINILGSGTISILTYVLPPLLHLVLVTSKILTTTMNSDTDSNSDSNDHHIIEISKNSFFLPTQQLWIDRCLFLLGLSFATIATSVTFVSVYEQITSPNSQC